MIFSSIPSLILDLLIEISQGESKVKPSCHHHVVGIPLSLSLFSNHSYFVTVLPALQYNCNALFFISRHIFHSLQSDTLIGVILVDIKWNIIYNLWVHRFIIHYQSYMSDSSLSPIFGLMFSRWMKLSLVFSSVA